jgi:glycosyltransferase involved in cell wall biosynthesis
MSDVAIIISNYNYGDFVIDAIHSAINQTYPCKVIIVDDGSTDHSIDTIFSRLGKYRSSDIGVVRFPYYSGLLRSVEFSENVELLCIKNSGASTARNVGMWHAWNSVEYFAILDADDVYHHNKVEVLLQKMKEFNEIGVVYSDYNIIRPLYTKEELKEPYDKTLLGSKCMVHSGALIRKKYLEKVLLENNEIYDSKLHGPGGQEFIGCTEDYDLWLRLSNFCMFCHVPKVLSDVRELGHNQSLKMNSRIFASNMNTIKQR